MGSCNTKDGTKNAVHKDSYKKPSLMESILRPKGKNDDKALNSKQITPIESVQLEFVKEKKPEVEFNKQVVIKRTDLIRPQVRDITKLYAFQAKVLHKCHIAELRFAENVDSKVVRVIKCVKKDSLTLLEKKQILREILTLKRMDHPNIVKLYEIIESRFFYYIVREYIKGYDLMTEIAFYNDKLTEDVIMNIMRGLMSAVKCLHENDLVHGKIQTSKLIISKGEPVLVGFGVVRTVKTDLPSKDYLDYPYILSPESIHKRLDQKSDIWACGILMYEMVSGVRPFTGTDEEVYAMILRRDFIIPLDKITHMSAGMRRVLNMLLENDPNKRPSAETVMQDSWFQNYAKTMLPELSLRRIVINAKSLAFKTKLQEALFSHMANKSMTEDDKVRILARFKSLDKDHDGKIIREELITRMHELGFNANKKELDDAFDAVDVDKNGIISFSEFVDVAMDRNKLLYTANVMAVFRRFDKNNNGRLSLTDFKAIFTSSNEGLKEELLKQLTVMDLDGDQLVSFNEFKQGLEKLLNS